MKRHKISSRDRYPIRVRLNIITVVTGFAVVFYLFPRFFTDVVNAATNFDDQVAMLDIPPSTIFNTPPPPPSRPSIPVESEDEDYAEDVTIEETILDPELAWELPPMLEGGPKVKFFPYEKAPVPIGGYLALMRNVRYPTIAQEAGIEGEVIVQAFIDTKGRVLEVIVLKGVPNTGLNEAAIDAVRRTLFTPAEQRDKPVAVWIAIPINFRLTD